MFDKKLKVLFVGNSYTYFYDMPYKAFTQAAASAGYDVEVTAITRGGYRLCQFADPENEEGKRLRDAVNGCHYDVAVLQEQSSTPIKDEMAFFSGVEGVKSIVSADNFVLYATWGRNDGCELLTELGLTREEMTEKLSLAYNKVGTLYDMRVAEVGKAFLAYPSKDELYDPDKSHPSAVGSELAAKVIWQAIECVTSKANGYVI